METVISLMLWPPYLYIRTVHWFVWQTMDTIEYVKRG